MELALNFSIVFQYLKNLLGIRDRCRAEKQNVISIQEVGRERQTPDRYKCKEPAELKGQYIGPALPLQHKITTERKGLLVEAGKRSFYLPKGG